MSATAFVVVMSAATVVATTTAIAATVVTSTTATLAAQTANHCLYLIFCSLTTLVNGTLEVESASSQRMVKVNRNLVFCYADHLSHESVALFILQRNDGFWIG